MTIPKVSTLSLTVRDTRGAGSQWKIKAQATGPLISTTSGKSLSSNALVFVNGTSVQSLVGQQVLVYPGTTQQELTIVSWDADKGLLIKMTPEDFLNIVPGDVYSTTINWTLEDTP